MKKHALIVVRGLLFGLLLALFVAAVPTFLDWYGNPSGIFRGSTGTNWDFVFETLFSWLWPLFIVFAPAAIGVLFWISSRKSKHAASR